MLERRNLLFDFEVFPHWWCMSHRYDDSPSEDLIITSDMDDAVKRIKFLISSSRLIGFNIKAYDLYIMNAIVNGLTPERIYQISEDLISNVSTPWTKTWSHYSWNWIDLFSDWKFGSLKMFEANQGLPIVESSVPFGKENLTDEDKADIIKYCHADTWASYLLWEKRRDYFGIHEFVSSEFGVALNKAYQKTMASLTAAAVQARKPTNILPEDKSKDIYVLDYIDRILHTTPFDYLLINERSERVYEYEGDRFILGVGGVHSDYDKPIIVESNDERTVWSIDFTQYYPNMLVKFKLMPRSVPEVGVAIFTRMIQAVKDLKVEISRLKHSGDHVAAAQLNSKRDKYKVLINALSGAMRNKWSNFYDPSRIITMCAVGQFLLIAIVLDIKKSFPGTEILQTNTDGAYLLVPNEYDLQAKMDEIMNLIHFDIEVDACKKIIQRDVNNYVCVFKDGSVKTKGAWIYKKRDLFKPAKYAVCSIAVLNYLLYGTPIEETIRNDRDIMDFVCCAKTGGTFQETIYRVDDADTPTTSTNRFIASKGVKGVLYKVKDKSYHKVADCPSNCLLLNESIDEYDFDTLNVDYDFYIKYAHDLLPNFYIL